MEKKASEFLLDTKLGEKKFEIQKDTTQPVVLNIEGATPVALLETVRKGRIWRKVDVKSWYARLDAFLGSLGRAKPQDIATFSRLLAVMINAGIPLVRSLDVIFEQTGNAQLKKTIYDIARTIEKGGTLSGGMTGFPNIFSESQIGMVRSGEASGQLNKILNDLAFEVEKFSSIQKKIRGALIYPIFIIAVLVLIVAGMLIFVVPKIAEIFTGTGQQLPLITRIVINTSDFMVAHWTVLLTGVLALFVGIPFTKKIPGLRRPMDELLISIPIIGRLVQKAILARFARSLSNLIRSGIPIIQTLQINAKGIGNAVYQERILLAAEDLSRGIPLGESLRDSSLFPSLLVQMVSIGEQTAQLDTVTLKVAEYYEEEVDIAVQSFARILEPFIIVMVGISVGGIVAAIMLPIIQLVSVSEML